MDSDQQGNKSYKIWMVFVTVHEDATNDNERFTGMAEFNAINGMWYDIDEPTDMYLRWMPLPAPYRGGEMT